MEEESSRSARANERDKRNASFQTQDEFFKALREMSRDWTACATAEVELRLKLSKKLIAAQSVPDAVKAYGEWLSEEMGARAEDARRMLSHGQKPMDTGSRFLSHGWVNPGATTWP
jgi:hypothetical protein